MATRRRPTTVWQAVADPTRRRVIELLREGPRTTGDLAQSFAVTRFAVMKHLRVLEQAGVIHVRRDGRQRWNELDPASLVEIGNRWPSAAAAPDAGQSGTSAGEGPARRSEDPETTTPSGPASGGTTHLRLDLDVFVDASPALVFDALTFSISSWWGPPYLRSTAATGVVLEGHLGGRFYEEWGHRQGALLGTVTAIRQDERLEVTGWLGPERLLPSVLDFALAPRAGGTLLHFTHRALLAAAGASASTVTRYRAAWKDLLAGRLKAFVERGRRSGIGHAPGAGTSEIF